ncbi:hypothetical protein F8S13_01515 [Chloroflexia bacterium SDU3-3]|nr:hypothetical protein F8S13_01515 [Chloroflexia bacterium SDU3-3]
MNDAPQSWYKFAKSTTLEKIALGIITVQIIGAGYTSWTFTQQFVPTQLIYLASELTGVAITLYCIVLLRRGLVEQATGLLSFSILIPILMAALPFGLTHGNVLMIATTIPLMIAGLYSGRRGLIAMAIMIIAYVVVLGTAELQEWYIIRDPPQDVVGDTLSIILVIIIFTWVVYTYVGELQDSRMLMQNYQMQLESEVERRTSELHAALAAAEQARAHAEQADAAKSMFIASTSHELRTPLHAIMAMSKYLGKDGPLNTTQQNHLSRVLTNASHLLDLINNVLDISKIESGLLLLDRQEMQIGQLFDSVLRDTALLVRQHSLIIKSDIPTDLPRIWADPVRLKQVLINLISNAVKFTPMGTITISAQLADGLLRIAVADTGIGIAEGDLETIFLPFRQAQNSLSRQYGGSGLGLPISRHLIELHGGTLSVQSTLGLGATFTIHLPIHPVVAADAPQ